MRVHLRVIRCFVLPTIVLVVVWQNVLYNAEKLFERTKLRAAGDRLDDQLLGNAGPQ